MKTHEPLVRQLVTSAIVGDRFAELIRRWEQNNEPPPKPEPKLVTSLDTLTLLMKSSTLLDPSRCRNDGALCVLSMQRTNISTGRKRSLLPEDRLAGSCGNEDYPRLQVMHLTVAHNGLSMSPYLARTLSAEPWSITKKRTRLQTVLRLLLQTPSSSSQSKRLKMEDYEDEATEDLTWQERRRHPI
jgi:hypothetical protein